MSKKTLKQIILIVLIGVVSCWAINNNHIIFGLLDTFFNVTYPLILGGAIAFIVNIPMKWIEGILKKLFSRFNFSISPKLIRATSLILAAVFVIGALIALIFILIPEVSQTILSFKARLPEYLDSLEAYITDISKHIESFYISLPDFDINYDKVLQAFDFVSNQGQAFLGNTIGFTTSIFSGILNLFLSLTFAVYLLSEKERVGRWLKKAIFALLPDKWADYTINVISRADKAFSSFISGQLIEAVILGILCFIGMNIFSFQQPLLISVIVAFTALIPVFGAWIGALLGAFVILLTAPSSTIWFLIFIIILQQIETNIIYPKVVGQSVGIPGILVLASVTIGGNLFGIVGMLISVPVCSVLYSIFKEIIEHFETQKRTKESA